MSSVDLAQLVPQLGVAAPFVVYLIWRETADRKLRERDIESREKLTAVLAALSIAITGKPHV